MENRDNEQYSTPQDKPKPNKGGPRMPGDEKENNIRSGAAQEDQLDKLKPQAGADKAANEIGNPPNTDVNTGS